MIAERDTLRKFTRPELEEMLLEYKKKVAKLEQR